MIDKKRSETNSPKKNGDESIKSDRSIPSYIMGSKPKVLENLNKTF